VEIFSKSVVSLFLVEVGVKHLHSFNVSGDINGEVPHYVIFSNSQLLELSDVEVSF
jgi:hypothetical protein